MQQKVAIITGIRGMDAEALTDILLRKGYRNHYGKLISG